MNRIAALFIAMFPCTLAAHPCPFDWNIEFANETEIKGTSLSDFVAKFNEAVKKETKGEIAKAIIYESKPDTFQKVPEDTPFSKEMDGLIQRYVEVTAPLIKKGVEQYGTSPIGISFPAKFPVACMLSGQFYGGAMNYEELKEGARVTRRRAVLECRAYQVSRKFLEAATEWQREERIPAEADPVSYFFARFNEMTWAFNTRAEAEKESTEESILGGVTLYLPEKKVVLALETKEKHEEMAESMQERHYLENPAAEGADRNPPLPDKP